MDALLIFATQRSQNLIGGGWLQRREKRRSRSG